MSIPIPHPQASTPPPVPTLVLPPALATAIDLAEARAQYDIWVAEEAARGIRRQEAQDQAGHAVTAARQSAADAEAAIRSADAAAGQLARHVADAREAGMAVDLGRKALSDWTASVAARAAAVHQLEQDAAEETMRRDSAAADLVRAYAAEERARPAIDQPWARVAILERALDHQAQAEAASQALGQARETLNIARAAVDTAARAAPLLNAQSLAALVVTREAERATVQATAKQAALEAGAARTILTDLQAQLTQTKDALNTATEAVVRAKATFVQATLDHDGAASKLARIDLDLKDSGIPKAKLATLQQAREVAAKEESRTAALMQEASSKLATADAARSALAEQVSRINAEVPGVEARFLALDGTAADAKMKLMTAIAAAEQAIQQAAEAANKAIPFQQALEKARLYVKTIEASVELAQDTLIQRNAQAAQTRADAAQATADPALTHASAAQLTQAVSAAGKVLASAQKLVTAARDAAAAAQAETHAADLALHAINAQLPSAHKALGDANASLAEANATLGRLEEALAQARADEAAAARFATEAQDAAHIAQEHAQIDAAAAAAASDALAEADADWLAAQSTLAQLDQLIMAWEASANNAANDPTPASQPTETDQAAPGATLQDSDAAVEAPGATQPPAETSTETSVETSGEAPAETSTQDTDAAAGTGEDINAGAAVPVAPDPDKWATPRDPATQGNGGGVSEGNPTAAQRITLLPKITRPLRMSTMPMPTRRMPP